MLQQACVNHHQFSIMKRRYSWFLFCAEDRSSGGGQGRLACSDLAKDAPLSVATTERSQQQLRARRRSRAPGRR